MSSQYGKKAASEKKSFRALEVRFCRERASESQTSVSFGGQSNSGTLTKS